MAYLDTESGRIYILGVARRAILGEEIKSISDDLGVSVTTGTSLCRRGLQFARQYCKIKFCGYVLLSKARKSPDEWINAIDAAIGNAASNGNGVLNSRLQRLLAEEKRVIEKHNARMLVIDRKKSAVLMLINAN